MRFITVLFLLIATMLQAQQADSMRAVDSVLVHKTTFTGFAVSHAFHKPIAPSVYYLRPEEGTDQLYQVKIYSIQRIGYVMNFSLHKKFSANVELGANIYDLKKTMAIVTDVVVLPSGHQVANDWYAWDERRIGASAYVDFSVGYRPVHTPRFDLYVAPGGSLHTKYQGIPRLTPAAQYYVSVVPKVQLKRRSWLQFRADYGVNSSEAFLKYRTYVMLQAGLVFRFDSKRMEPKKKPLYIRVYDNE